MFDEQAMVTGTAMYAAMALNHLVAGHDGREDQFRRQRSGEAQGDQLERVQRQRHDAVAAFDPCSRFLQQVAAAWRLRIRRWVRTVT